MSFNASIPNGASNGSSPQVSDFDRLMADVKSDINRAINRHEDFARKQQNQHRFTNGDNQGASMPSSQHLQDRITDEIARARSMEAEEARRALGELDIGQSTDAGRS